MDKVNSAWIRAIVKAAYLEGYDEGAINPLRQPEDKWKDSDQKAMLDMKYPEE